MTTTSTKLSQKRPIYHSTGTNPQETYTFDIVRHPNLSFVRKALFIKKGDTDLCGKINTALEKMVSDGSWEKAVESTVGKSGFKPDAKNPPKPDACS